MMLLHVIDQATTILYRDTRIEYRVVVDLHVGTGSGNVGPMGHFDKLKCTFLWLILSHFHTVEPTSWLDVSHVFSSQTTIAVSFEWEKTSFIDFYW